MTAVARLAQPEDADPLIALEKRLDLMAATYDQRIGELIKLLRDVSSHLKRIEDTPVPLPGQTTSLFRPVERGELGAVAIANDGAVGGADNV